MSSIQKINTEEFDSDFSKRQGLVLVDFYADWCQPCKAMEPALDDLAREYEGELTIVKVDTDAEDRICERLGIRGIPALLLYKNGETVERLSGAQSRSFMTGVIEKHLEA